MENIDIEIESKDTKYELVFTQSFSLLNKNDIVTIKLPQKYFNWTMKFVFQEASESNKEYSTEQLFEPGNITYKFFGWYSDSYVENTTALQAFNKSRTVELFTKIRTSATKDKDFRLVIISVWRKK